MYGAGTYLHVELPNYPEVEAFLGAQLKELGRVEIPNFESYVYTQYMCVENTYIAVPG